MKTKIIYILLTIIEIITITAIIITCSRPQREIKAYPVLYTKAQIIDAMNSPKQLYIVVDAPITGRRIDEEIKNYPEISAQLPASDLLYISCQKETYTAANFTSEWVSAEDPIIISSRDVQLYDNIHMESLDKYTLEGKSTIIPTSSNDTRYEINILSNNDAVTFLAVVGDHTFSIVHGNDLAYDLFVDASVDELADSIENNSVFAVVFSIIIYTIAMITAVIIIDSVRKKS